ncbi:serine hydrolase domain-containing protein [Microbacterium yannicii]|uniref:serine hydrolase domain-containing protein n=1 Tax=Microbacterium yannicii TaxID=671622 RepID=UPI0002ED1C7B|nr:serine hydrolase domain-containing protein [Microbacterium yannicii]
MNLDRAILDAAAAKNSFSGVVTIDEADERTFSSTYGFAHRGYGVENSADTQFAIASGSKAFTALTVMRLVEDGVLRLDQRARGILGADLPLIDDGVTVEHLLTHSSGIGDYLDEEGEWEPSDFVLSVPVHTLTSAEAFLPLVDGFPQKFAPGDRFSYCNGGYMVLAILLERVTGRVFHDIVREQVFSRAALEDTDFLRSNELPGTAATGYIFDEGDTTNTLHLPVLGNGDGGAFTTAADLHRFWRAFYAGDIVSSDSVIAMTQPRFDVPHERKRYGMGFWLHRTTPAASSKGTTQACLSARRTSPRRRRPGASSATARRAHGR